MNATLLSQDDAQELLGDDITLFRDCLDVGAESFHQKFGAEATLSSRSRASIIHDYAEAHAEVVFGPLDGYKTRRVSRLFVVEVRERLLVRFRRFADSRGFGFSRNDTDQTKDWEAQRPIEGFPELTHLVAGYRLDEFQREVKDADLVCTIDNRYQWHIPLPVSGEVVELPRRLDQDAAAATATSSVLRSTLKEEDAAADDSQE